MTWKTESVNWRQGNEIHSMIGTKGEKDWKKSEDSLRDLWDPSSQPNQQPNFMP